MDTSDIIAILALLVSIGFGIPGVLGFLDARAIRKEAQAADIAAFDRRLRVEAVKHSDLLTELFISFEAADRTRTLDVQLDPITPGARFVQIGADGAPNTARGLYEQLFVRLHAPAPETTFWGRCFLQSPTVDGETEIEVRVFSGPDPERAFLISRRAIIPHAIETPLTTNDSAKQV